ncbi:Glutamate--cysteine ligase [Carnimonas sp. R-84981]|uniref:glutamate--cysteine ligase n=1 Tax=Carnimonas bestiolae TaxID=3402172 RepID=UPI003EDBEF86
MTDYFEGVVSALMRSASEGRLGRIRRGIEKEGLRVDAEGRISQQPHQRELGSKLTHPHITTDYSESLLEYVTPVFPHPSDALDFLADLHRITYRYIGDEVVWPASMPARLNGNDSVPIADFGSSNSGRMKHVYRRGLDVRYGRIMQSIAGIHYNVSFPDTLWQVLADAEGQSDVNARDYRSEKYFRVIRNFRRHGWLLMYLFGASPAIDKSFLDGRSVEGFEAVGKSTLLASGASSLRMSDLGYQNKVQDQLKVRFDTLNHYVETLRSAVSTPWPAYQQAGTEVDGEWRQLSDTILQIENEYYSDIRPKRVVRHHQTPTQALEAEGVEYIEVRCLDINPLLPLGIDEQQTRFIDTFLLYCLLDSGDVISDEEEQRIVENRRRVVTNGLDPQLTLASVNGEVALADAAEDLFRALKPVAEVLDASEPESPHADALNVLAQRVRDPSLTPAGQIAYALASEQRDFVDWTLGKARQHAAWFAESPIDPARDTCLEELAEQSWQQQQALEQDTSVPFDEYVRRYFACAEKHATPR